MLRPRKNANAYVLSITFKKLMHPLSLNSSNGPHMVQVYQKHRIRIFYCFSNHLVIDFEVFFTKNYETLGANFVFTALLISSNQ